MEGMSSHLKELWEDWELRVVVLLSLIIQVLLIFLGHDRKYRTGAWLKVLLWLCYLVADVAAIYALGKIATWLKLMQHDTAKGLDRNAQMVAFWAPFLLLHLGGPDSITAYSLEDNELWLRHGITLAIQTALTLYIFFQVLTGSDLWVLALLMLVSGFIKCAERIYVLWAASSNQFRDSIPDHPLHYSKILEEYNLKKAEGYDITPHEVIEVRRVNTENVDRVLSSPDEELLSDELKKKLRQGTEKRNCGQYLLAKTRGLFDIFRRIFGDRNLLPKAMSERNRAELAAAKDLIDIFRRVFADLVLSFQDRDTSMLILKGKHFHVVFRVIEIELGLMFNLLYTKAMVIHNRWGFALRIVSILSIIVVLGYFSWSVKDNYTKINVYVTFVLLLVAILLEIYALFVILFSDETACWLMNHWPASLDFVERLKPLYNRRRWSGSMPQYNLISFALKEKHLACHRILELLHVDQVALKVLYEGEVKVSDYLKEQVRKCFESQAISKKEGQSVWTYRGDLTLRKKKLWGSFKSSIELDFDQSILIWHIATELLCQETLTSNAEMSKQLSRYMLYLLVKYPFLLPVGVGHVKFRDMYMEAMSILNERRSMITNRAGTHSAEERFNIATACAVLRDDVNTQLDPMVAKGDKSKFTLYKGCYLASQLDDIITDQEEKWDIISSVWMEMLGYAAIKCGGLQHARQLRQGGQFLTHVWLLMAHFGLTDHFQIPHDPAIAELLVRQD